MPVVIALVPMALGSDQEPPFQTEARLAESTATQNESAQHETATSAVREGSSGRGSDQLPFQVSSLPAVSMATQSSSLVQSMSVSVGSVAVDSRGKASRTER